MLSVLAIVLAMNMWAPLNNGVAPCGQHGEQLNIHYYVQGNSGVPGGSIGYAFTDHRSCEIWIDQKMIGKPYYKQCWIVAHEVGHAFFNFDHSSDETNIMFPNMDIIPDECYLHIKSARLHRGSIPRAGYT